MATLNISVEIPSTGFMDLEEFKAKLTNYANRLAAHYTTAKEYEEEKPKNLYISDRIKSLETGFKCDDNLSDNYKEELLEILDKRYK